MSVFDDDLVSRDLHPAPEEVYLAQLLGPKAPDYPQVQIIWLEDGDVRFSKMMEERIQKKESIDLRPGKCVLLCEFVPQDTDWTKKLEVHRGRPVISVDCSKLRRNDTDGFFETLARMASSPTPIIIIENITDIPDGDRAVYDDPLIVENRLLHSWKDYSRPATILIPIVAGKSDKLNLSRLRNDGYARSDFAKELETE